MFGFHPRELETLTMDELTMFIAEINRREAYQHDPEGGES